MASPSGRRISPFPARRRAWAVAFVAALGAARAPAQAPEITPGPAAPPAAHSPEASPAPGAQALIDQIAQCVEGGKLNVEIDLQAGRVPASAGWTVEVIGAPKAALAAEAAEGRIRRLDVAITQGGLLVKGKGLRPDVFIEGLHFEEGKGITEARFRGRGIWRPILGIFRGLAMSAVRKLELRTDVPSVLRGEVLGPETAAASQAAAERGPSFLDLVAEVRVKDSEFTALGGRPLAFGEMVEFQTASQPRTGTSLRVAVEKGTFRPSRSGQPAQFDVAGRIDGEIENGSAAFLGGRGTFSRGQLTKGTFQVRSGEGGTLETAISAAAFTLDLTSGQLRLPGGPTVGVQAPSRFAVRDLRLRPDGNYSGTLDAELFGKVGTIDRGGTTISASGVKLRTRGATIINGRATGDIELEFEYRMDYPLVVTYPIKQIGARRVPLIFAGPFAATLHLQDAGSGDEGVVTGEYQFKVPWPPVEQAAFEVLRAKWSQDVPIVIRRVNFVIEPRRFGPCGENCFLVDLDVTAEKRGAKGYLFRQVCHPQGKADLVVQAASRSFLLRNVRIEPRCKGIVGWLANLVGPLLTKSYTDVTLFQMPEDMPFTIESVGSGVNWLAIGGKIAWSSKTSNAPSKSE